MNIPLAPDHKADLHKSGLSEYTIRQAQIKSVRPCDINRRIGFDLPGLMSAYRIPFPPNFHYSRFKVFYAPGQEHYSDGKKKPKYIQLKGTPNRLYIPPALWTTEILQDPARPLWITEGEKKALKATQEGIPTIAICGLWNWKKPGNGTDELIPDFDLVSWQGRNVHIVPDNDWLQPDKDGKPKNLKQAVFRLCWALQARGANTFIVQIPGGVHGK